MTKSPPSCCSCAPKLSSSSSSPPSYSSANSSSSSSSSSSYSSSSPPSLVSSAAPLSPVTPASPLLPPCCCRCCCRCCLRHRYVESSSSNLAWLSAACTCPFAARSSSASLPVRSASADLPPTKPPPPSNRLAPPPPSSESSLLTHASLESTSLDKWLTLARSSRPSEAMKHFASAALSTRPRSASLAALRKDDTVACVLDSLCRPRAAPTTLV
mmetsp:Transcript_29120/g.52685  ORF Transcript_29120/g.52685 Transcript_29120/m.52685 type:complete len:214 (+) Transcript_29120:618-1259(+)